MALRSKPSSAVAANDRLALLGHEADGHGLADRVPELALEAQRIASTVAHGMHGRKRSGPGENFWQFRQLQIGDPAHSIDWRRSASSDHLFIREREWETAHTVWLWPDLSPSMAFKSHLASITKRERTLVLMFALGGVAHPRRRTHRCDRRDATVSIPQDHYKDCGNAHRSFKGRYADCEHAAGRAHWSICLNDLDF